MLYWNIDDSKLLHIIQFREIIMRIEAEYTIEVYSFSSYSCYIKYAIQYIWNIFKYDVILSIEVQFEYYLLHFLLSALLNPKAMAMKLNQTIKVLTTSKKPWQSFLRSKNTLHVHARILTWSMIKTATNFSIVNSSIKEM